MSDTKVSIVKQDGKYKLPAASKIDQFQVTEVDPLDEFKQGNHHY